MAIQFTVSKQNMDKLVAIKVFKRVVELRSFYGAAEDLGLSRAAVSKNIAELERHLGTALIKRTTRTMHVTPNGQEYYYRVRELLNLWDVADQNAKAASNTVSGVVTITIPMSLGLVSIQPKLCLFATQYPDVKLNVILSDEQVDLVSNGIDVAVRGSGHLQDSTLRAKKLDTLPRVLCVSPSYLSSSNRELNHPTDIYQHSCLVYSLSSSPTRWTFFSEKEECQVEATNVRMQTNNTLALKQACLQGLGIMLAPEIMVREELMDGRLQHVLQEWSVANHDLYAVYPQHKEHSATVSALIHFLSH